MGPMSILDTFGNGLASHRSVTAFMVALPAIGGPALVQQLPKAMQDRQGRTVQVVGENRTISPNASGTLANVNSYHVSRIS